MRLSGTATPVVDCVGALRWDTVGAVAWQITCDTGGTFTDVVVADREGFRHLAKAPTTRAQIADGIEAALRRAADAIGVPLAGLLGATDRFVMATTKATNAIIEGDTAKTAFLTTRGFPDILVFREGGRHDPFRFEPTPPPFVPRELTFELTGRIAADGEVLVPLDEAEIGRIAAGLRERGVEAVGVCLLWAIANPAHEQRVAELLAAACPGVAISVSHRVNPVIREYRRASATVLDAALKPLLQGHLRELADRLAALGLRAAPEMATSTGGTLPLEGVIESPLLALDCGPAMAPLSARAWAQRELGAAAGDLIVVDTGGTSFDVSLVRDGEIAITPERWIGPRLHGHLTGLSAVDVHSVGAGGGSIAWVDAGGLLRVGPRSAGAEPGPACYGRGGSEPTVTDAAVVLGFIDPGFFLGGEMALEAELAHAALGGLAARLGLGLDEAAAGVLTIAAENMVTAIAGITIGQGIDPREATMVAGGGASGLFAVQIARELGVREVIVPPLAAGLSACGAQLADVVLERAATLVTRNDAFAGAEVVALIAKLRSEVERGLAGVAAGGGRSEAVLVDARYPLQAWELRTPVPDPTFAGPAAVTAVSAGFHALHRRLFAIANEQEPVEFVSWRVRQTVPQAVPRTASLPLAGTGAAGAGHGERTAYFAGLGRVSCPAVHVRDGVGGLDRLEGPAILDHPTTTIVLPPGSTATGSADGLVRISVSPAEAMA